MRNCSRCNNEYCVVDNDGSSATHVSIFLYLKASLTLNASAIGAIILAAERGCSFSTIIVMILLFR
jgi:hypothetical protein